MSALIDNLIALKIVKMLVTPFAQTDAYRLGIIDAHGKNLRKASSLTTTAEKEAYTYLHRLVFNMKKILVKLPGGDSKLKSLVAALFLVKEYYQSGTRSSSLMEARFNKIMEHMENGVVLVEEEMIVEDFLEKYLAEDGAAVGAVPANVTGAAVSTDVPNILNKTVKKYQRINRRAAPKQVK